MKAQGNRHTPRAARVGLRIPGVAALCIVAALAFLLIGAHSGVSRGVSHGVSRGADRASGGPSSLPLIPEGAWGRWSKDDLGVSFPMVKAPFAVGQTVALPGDLSIRVDGVDRNWAPAQPSQAPKQPVGGQDDYRGKEIMLVRFTVSNLGDQTLMFDDGFFSLVRATGHEQRDAAIAALPGTEYGSFGQTAWLMPGTTAHTFVPFLVNPGERPRAFVFDRYRIEMRILPGVTPSPGAGKLANQKAVVVGMARILFALPAGAGASSQAVAATPPVTFNPDSVFTVGAADIYS